MLKSILLVLSVGVYVVIIPGCKTLEKTTVNVNLNVNLTVPMAQGK